MTIRDAVIGFGLALVIFGSVCVARPLYIWISDIVAGNLDHWK